MQLKTSCIITHRERGTGMMVYKPQLVGVKVIHKQATQEWTVQGEDTGLFVGRPQKKRPKCGFKVQFTLDKD